MITDSTRVIDLTVGELRKLILSTSLESNQQTSCNSNVRDEFVYGISGIMKLFNCSRSVVYKYRNEGWLEPAIMQEGRKIVCNANKAIELFGSRNKRNKRLQR